MFKIVCAYSNLFKLSELVRIKMDKIPTCVIQYIMNFLERQLNFVSCCKNFIKLKITTEIFAKQTDFKFLKPTNLVLDKPLCVPDGVIVYIVFNIQVILLLLEAKL